MRWLIVFLLGLASVAQTSEAKACSCMRLTPAEGLSSSQAVFTGEAIAIEKNEATKFGGLEITLRVGQVWKGAIEEQIKVHTAASSAACGYTFVVGTKYLVYAFSDETDPMRVSLCSRTAPLENAKEDLDFLGKPSHHYDQVGKKGAKASGESNGRCSASAFGAGASSLGWLVALLMGVTITRKRIV